MREPATTTTSLAGSFLIAHPGLVDPNFHRAVIHLPDYSAKSGSFGLVLNRPTGKVLGDLLGSKPLGQLARVPVLSGGPVETSQLLLATFQWHPATRLIECRHHLSPEEAETLVAAQNHTVRAFVGYAGWGGGQIETEITQRSWLVRRADTEQALELDNAPRIWRDLTSTFGPWFKLVAEAPEDPSGN